MLSHIKIVLVETTHPGNIGAVARAMKNMQMENLWLVAPKIFPHAEATARAAGADDLLARAKVCDSLQEAIDDCELVLGTSARCRTISWPEITPRECATKIILDAKPKTAILFGREHSGLKNHEMDLCHFLLRIPCNPDFSSLNVAAAVQILCYEFFIAADLKIAEKPIGDKGECPLATAAQMESFYAHLHQALLDIGFLRPEQSQSMMRRLRRIYNRIQLDTKELDILRGILRMSQDNQLGK